MIVLFRILDAEVEVNAGVEAGFALFFEITIGIKNNAVDAFFTLLAFEPVCDSTVAIGDAFCDFCPVVIHLFE